MVAAICDSEILGKRFEEGIRVLDVTKSFFGGEEIESEKLRDLIVDLAREDSTFNIAGKNSVRIALECGLVSRMGVRIVDGIPFALVLL